jgi:signal transduction histidine kinase
VTSSTERRPEAPERAGVLRGASLRPRELERAYRERFLREDGRAAAVVIGGISLLTLLFIPSDRLFIHGTEALRLALGARVGFALMSAGLVWVILRSRRPWVMDAAVLLWALAVVATSVLTYLTRPGDYHLPVAGDFILVVIFWALLPNRFELQALSAGALTVGSVLMLALKKDPLPPAGTTFVGVCFVATHFVGALLSRRAHRSRRSLFLEHRQAVRAEAALRVSESRMRMIARSFPKGSVALIDEDDRVVVLDGTIVFLGAGPEAVVGRRVAECVPPEMARHLDDALRRARRGEVVRVENRAGGHIVETHVSSALGDGHPTGMCILVSQDVTEHRRLEESLAVASRLASMGTLVAGVAHEINNPLAGIMANLGTAIEDVRQLQELLRRGEEPREVLLQRAGEVAEMLEDASEGAVRIARIVRDLAVFGRPEPQQGRIRLADVVDGAMRWLPATVSSVATLEVEDRGPPDVTASAGQIEQVLVNLVTNAARAISGGTRGVIRVRIGPGAPGHAILEVIDQGEGIPPAILNRIFDPFFTTRPAGEGKGMGLGLAISQAIVTAHGGTLMVNSEPGQGSTFRMELPAATEKA